MTGSGVGRSPLEIFAIGLALVVMVGVGLLWGVGIVVGSIVGSSLPAGGEGVVAILRSIPDIGSAWHPPVSSGLIWVVAMAVVAGLAPLAWRLIRSGHLPNEGAHWATANDLRRAGLLVAEVPLQREEPEAGDA